MKHLKHSVFIGMVMVEIKNIRLHHYQLPVKEPLYVRGSRLNMREGYILEFQGPGGYAGYGEIAPLPGFSKENLKDSSVIGWIKETPQFP